MTCLSWRGFTIWGVSRSIYRKLAIINTVSLVVIASFCVFVVVCFLRIGQGFVEGQQSNDRELAQFSADLKKFSDEERKAQVEVKKKFEDWHPFEQLNVPNPATRSSPPPRDLPNNLRRFDPPLNSVPPLQRGDVPMPPEMKKVGEKKLEHI